MKAILPFLIFSALTAVAQEKEVLLQTNLDLIDDVRGEVDLVLDISDPVQAAKSKDGKHLIATDKKINLYVHIQHGKVASYLAYSFSGKPLQVTQSKGIQSCLLCVINEAGNQVCWKLACSEMPPAD
jgi:hypothetical protein